MPTLDDELPQAPSAEETGSTTTIDVPVSDALMNEVPKWGDPVPQGTYHFRLESFDEKQTDPTKAKKDKSGAEVAPKYTAFADGSAIDLAMPYFMLHWTCQSEPYTGRKVRDFCPWVSKQIVDKANAGDAIAKIILKDRLGKFKLIKETIGFQGSGGATNPKDLFSLNPEVKIQVGLQASRSNIGGVWKDDGGSENKVIRYIPLMGRG